MPLTPDDIVSKLTEGQRTAILAAVRAGVLIGNSVPVGAVVAAVADTAQERVKLAIPTLTGGLLGVFASYGQGEVSFTVPGYAVARRLQEQEVEREPWIPPELPFLLENPGAVEWDCDAAFRKDIKGIEKDGNLRPTLKREMEGVLRAPDRGKILGVDPFKGMHREPVAHNCRLIWRLLGTSVVFHRFLRKDDPDYVE